MEIQSYQFTKLRNINMDYYYLNEFFLQNSLDNRNEENNQKEQKNNDIKK